MRIGYITPLHGRPDAPPAPSWSSVLELARTAEAVGFDMFVYEDALLYRSEEATDGSWDATVISGGLRVSSWARASPPPKTSLILKVTAD